jgi:LmbE family N-acetylglucosaminyl deacetylase
MNGPTPIISSMLNSTAERRPMRRWSNAEVPAVVDDKITRATPSFEATLADCTLAGTMFFAERVPRVAASAVLAGLILSGTQPNLLVAQQEGVSVAELPPAEPQTAALPLAEDRGQAALEQTLKRLRTTASLMMIVAHPDDEDGALLAYLSRGLGVRATLFTLTRGEGGQNAMSVDSYDALGIIRTNELLKADEFYGAKQLWGTEADFGFSKTQEESFARWGHDRVLYDTVLAVRRVRPQIIVSTFVGGITDGHGQHQVSGEIAQEAFKAAADPTVFPEQLKAGLQPWQPLAVYSMVPFAPVTDRGMFDYATGKWAPAKFHNYVTGEWTNGVPSTDVTVSVGTRDSTLGRSYAQIAREGWGEQKSQNGGANPALSGPGSTSYHLWAVAPAVQAPSSAHGENNSLFDNDRVHIDTSLAGLSRLAPGNVPDWLTNGLEQIDAALNRLESKCPCNPGLGVASEVAPIYRQTLDLRSKVRSSGLDAQAKASLSLELDAKVEQFQSALAELLGLDLVAFRTNEATVRNGGFRGDSADETPRRVSPGEEFKVRIHTSSASPQAHVLRTWFENQTTEPWKRGEPLSTAGTPSSSDAIFNLKVPENAESTQPFFTRPSIEQPYYDISNQEWRERSFAPWPLAAWAEFTFDGLPIRVGKVVETLERVTGPGGIYQPLVVTPAIGVRIDPEARILPLDGSALPVHVTLHAQSAAQGTVELKLPPGWHAAPEEAKFQRTSEGDTEPILFSVTPGSAPTGAFTIQAVAHFGGRTYQAGWQSLGYSGLLPYNQFQSAQLRTRKVDVRLAPALRIGYVMGTGDLVPDAIEGLGSTPHLLSSDEISSSDLSAWNVIVIGIRAYSARPELAAAQPRLEEFVRRGGTLIVQYQSSNFPAPLPLAMGRMPERVVDEAASVKLLDPSNRLLSWPNLITPADFDDWVEERGHSFLDTWDPGYTALTQTADAGQDPQRGGLLVTHPGKGTYIYVAYALYRQLPELVPGAYRILANLLSVGRPE